MKKKVAALDSAANTLANTAKILASTANIKADTPLQKKASAKGLAKGIAKPKSKQEIKQARLTHKPALMAKPVLSFSEKIKAMNTLALALVVSLLIHAVVLAVKFAPPELKKLRDNLPSLEVVLVNAKTLKKAEHVDVLAQANLDRGGNTDANRKLKTALPSATPKPTTVALKANVAARSSAQLAQESVPVTPEQKRIAALEKQAQALLTQLNNTHKVEALPTQLAVATQANNVDKNPQPVASKALDLAALSAQALEITRLEALLAKQQDEYQKRPKRKFIGARTQEYKFAMYVDAWRQKVERVGNLNYPEAAKQNKLYGQLRLTVSIRADGSLEAIEINKSSGSKILDEAARHIVQLAAPYARFPDDIRQDTDILSITRTWTFTRDESLAAE